LPAKPAHRALDLVPTSPLVSLLVYGSERLLIGNGAAGRSGEETVLCPVDRRGGFGRPALKGIVAPRRSFFFTG
jgi:hypothetical protein